MWKAIIIIDGAEEAKVTGSCKDKVLSQAGLFFSQYAQDFEYEIKLEVTKEEIK